MGFDSENPKLSINLKKALWHGQQTLKEKLVGGRNKGLKLKSSTVVEVNERFYDYILSGAQVNKDYSALSKEALFRCNVLRKKSLNVIRTKEQLCKAYNIEAD